MVQCECRSIAPIEEAAVDSFVVTLKGWIVVLGETEVEGEGDRRLLCTGLAISV